MHTARASTAQVRGKRSADELSAGAFKARFLATPQAVELAKFRGIVREPAGMKKPFRFRRSIEAFRDIKAARAAELNIHANAAIKRISEGAHATAMAPVRVEPGPGELRTAGSGAHQISLRYRFSRGGGKRLQNPGQMLPCGKDADEDFPCGSNELLEQSGHTAKITSGESIFYLIGMRLRMLAMFSAISLAACSSINNGWAENGGGYVKYSLNGGASYIMSIEPDGGELPTSTRHYAVFYAANKDRGDYLQILVNKPVLGDNKPVADNYYTYAIFGNAIKAQLFADSSNVKIDQKDDSTWTAVLDLLFQSCDENECSTDVSKGIRLTGRLRFWVDPDNN